MDAGARVSHYRIERQLGHGGMGQVYLAEDEILSRHVALKFVREDAASGGRLLRREALAAAALDHPFICKIFEIGESAEGPFIAMEFVGGRTLAAEISSGPLTTLRAIAIAVEIAEALDAAHGAGVIHRDLKPANVMLTPDDHVKIMDFGVAKRLDLAVSPSAFTQSTIAAGAGSPGTLSYMSPEQVLGGSIDARSDLFSVGILLHEMFAGVHPFHRETPLGTATAIAHDPAPPLPAEMTRAPLEGLQAILDRLLAKAPQDRYPSAHALVADLRHLAERQVQRTAATLPADTWWRRPRMVAGLLLAVALLGIGAYAIVSQRPALAFHERDWLVIADFHNQTGDATFDVALDSALGIAIQQSTYVNVLPRGRIGEAVRRAGRNPADKLDVALAADVAQREGARAVLAASITRVGSSYTLAANVLNPSTQEAVGGATVTARTKDDVLEALDELATRVRRQLGESMAAISQQRTPVLRATSSSLDALKLFSQGRKLVGNGENGGYKLIEEAIRLDPDFALAHAALGHRGYLSGNPRDGEPHFQKALSLADRLTVRERLWIQALAEDSRGNREAAVESYQAYLAAYPDDADGWFRLGWTLLATLDRPADAAESFKRVLRLNPAAAGARVNLATCYASLRRHAESLVEYRKAFELRPQMLNERFVNHEFGFTLVLAGELDEAKRTFEKLTAATDMSLQASGLRSLALLQMYRGRYGAALEQLGSAVMLNRNTKAALSEMRNRLFLAGAARMLGQRRRVAAEMSEVDRLIAQNAFEPGMLSFAASMHVRLGNLRAANEIRNRMTTAITDRLALSAVNRSTRVDEASIKAVEGQIALAQGRAEDAVVLLRTSQRLSEGAGAAEPLARALLAVARVQEAARTYDQLLQRAPVGVEEQEAWLLAHVELAKLLEAAGDRNAARALYEKFLAIWKDADGGLAPLREARSRLEALR